VLLIIAINQHLNSASTGSNEAPIMTRSLKLSASVTCFILLAVQTMWTADSFSPITAPTRCKFESSGLFAKGMGSKSKTKPAGGMGGMGGGGMAATKEVSAPFNVNAALMKSEKLYDKLLGDSNKSQQAEDKGKPLNNDDRIASEYMIAARAVSATSDIPASVKDWVPIAQLCLARPPHDAQQSEGTSDPALTAAISYYCRELSLAAANGSPVFNAVARNDIQYSVETLDSFMKYVYDDVISGGKNKDKKEDEGMTKAEARAVLQLEDATADKAVIKNAYRKLTFALHPDRFVGVERTEAEEQASKTEFAKVKVAYETLTSGVREESKSWYASLGGKARTDFFGPVELLSIANGKALMDKKKCEGAVTGVSRTLMQSFLVRNQAAAGQ
jgi:DnaJ domain